jgi:hypothetical protein
MGQSGISSSSCLHKGDQADNRLPPSRPPSRPRLKTTTGCLTCKLTSTREEILRTSELTCEHQVESVGRSVTKRNLSALAASAMDFPVSGQRQTPTAIYLNGSLLKQVETFLVLLLILTSRLLYNLRHVETRTKTATSFPLMTLVKRPHRSCPCHTPTRYRRYIRV